MERPERGTSDVEQGQNKEDRQNWLGWREGRVGRRAVSAWRGVTRGPSDQKMRPLVDDQG